MEIIEALKEMQDKINKAGKAPVLFVGSGLSRRYYGTPDWNELLERIACEVDVDKEEMKNWGGYEKRATELEYHCFAKKKPLYENGEDRRYPLRKIIKKIITERSTIFEHKAMEVNALASIIPTAIITTNYDELLEKTFGKKYNVCIGQDIIWSRADNNSKTIYKIHGSVSNPSTIVITQADYDDFMASSKYLYAKLMTLFWENPIVFMGYGIGDDNVKNVLDTILDVMTEEQKKEFEQRIWVLAHAKNNKESFEETELSTGKNKVKIKKFCLDESYSQFYEALSIATHNIQEKDLKFTISENAIDLLIKPLYQNQDKFKVMVRELLQNAMDACKKANKSIKVTIGVNIEGDNVKLSVADCGIGMDFNDITNYFLTIGKSSKIEDDNGLVGKFGIGILSIFLIGKVAKVYSRKEASIPIGICIFQSDNDKKVKRIDVNNGVFENNIATILEVNIDDEQIVKSLKEAKKIGEVMVVLGLDNYCVWDDSEITVAFNKTGEVKSLEKLDIDGMIRINDELYIKKIYEEDKMQKYPNEMALINDMITKVTFGAAVSSMMKNVDIPFFATRTKMDLFEKDVKPNLSRSEVEIDGELRDEIISCVYNEEADKLISGVTKQVNTGRVSALDFKRNVIDNCKLLKNQNIIYRNNVVLIPTKFRDVIHVYSSEALFIKLVEKVECDYNSHGINKSELGDMIESKQVKGIGVAYLDRYIYYATGSYNGFRMQVIKALFDMLGMNNNVPYDNATEMWSYINNNKEMLKGQYEEKAEHGIVWFDEQYKPMIAGMKSLENVLITKEWNGCIDNKFVEILKRKLDNAPDVRRHLVLE